MDTQTGPYTTFHPDNIRPDMPIGDAIFPDGGKLDPEKDD